MKRLIKVMGLSTLLVSTVSLVEESTTIKVEGIHKSTFLMNINGMWYISSNEKL